MGAREEADLGEADRRGSRCGTLPCCRLRDARPAARIFRKNSNLARHSSDQNKICSDHEPDGRKNFGAGFGNCAADREFKTVSNFNDKN